MEVCKPILLRMDAAKGLRRNVVNALLSVGAKAAGMKGRRKRAADIFAKHGEIAAKMKPARGLAQQISCRKRLIPLKAKATITIATLQLRRLG